MDVKLFVLYPDPALYEVSDLKFEFDLDLDFLSFGSVYSPIPALLVKIPERCIQFFLV